LLAFWQRRSATVIETTCHPIIRAVLATARAVLLPRAPVPVRGLPSGEVLMSNNSNWKRSLQDKINEHNRQHGSKPKGVSNKTMHERACSLFRSFTLLRRVVSGIRSIRPNSLVGTFRCSLTTGPATHASPTGVGSAV
jgi:hypothetical protein